MILESEIPQCPEHEFKSKMGNIFVNKKILEEYSVKIYKIDSYFCEHYKEKIQGNKNGCEHILFRTVVYFTEYLLAVEIDEKNMLAETLFLRRKDKKHQEKKLGCKFIRINTSKDCYDADYKASTVQTFISKFKDRQSKRLKTKQKTKQKN